MLPRQGVVLLRHRPLSLASSWFQRNDLLSYRFSTTKDELSITRRFSSTNEEKEQPITWLYTRTSNQMSKPRMILGLSSFHTLYWGWYTIDFIPKVNASPLEGMHIDPVVGYVGVMLALFCNIGSLLYPWSLISRIGLQGDKLCVVGHSLPTMVPSERGNVYEFGDVAMDPSAQETTRILERGEFGHGFILLKARGRRLPYLLQIQDSSEVLDSWTLLQVLMNTKKGARVDKIPVQSPKQTKRAQKRGQRGRFHKK